jgi:hypothetical protein
MGPHRAFDSNTQSWKYSGLSVHEKKVKQEIVPDGRTMNKHQLMLPAP